MCGIAGAVNFKLNQELLRKLMFHRGPDEQHGFSEDRIDLYHLRLSILDIADGKQPMRLHNRFTIVFNGEIYNHEAIRASLGISGTTHSDTETLLLLYEKMGPGMLDLLDGMFAFAIYDNHTEHLFIARDRAGKKPLYYYQDPGKLVFASTLNALKGLLPLEIAKEHFFTYLRLGVFYREQTPYRDVHELPAGTYLLINCKNLQIEEKRWWKVHDFFLQKQTDGFEEAIEKTDHFLQAAVKRRIDSSDLEVGCFLSGGIDSGMVTAIASKHTQKLKTFTVSFEGEYDEAPLAALVAAKYQTDHQTIRISFNHLKDDIEKILINYGEPFFDSSAIPSYYVSEAAKKHVTVILNGDGADELFGGYRRYVPFAKINFFKQPAWQRQIASLLQKILPAGHDKKSTYNYIYRLLSFAGKADVEMYLSAGLDIIEDFESAIISPGYDYLQPLRNDFRNIQSGSLTGLQQLMNMDFDCNLFSDLLVKMDVATMAHSLEGRSPFLCKELLEYIPGLPDAYKVKGSQTKVLLRALAAKYLPDTILKQPKRGFEIPLKNWVNHELKDMIQDYLGAGNAYCRGLLQPEFLTRLRNGRTGMPAEKEAKLIWTLFCLEVWYQKVYKNDQHLHA